METKIVRDTQSASQYRISFQPAVAGVIVANVLVNDIDVCGSPYTIEVARGTRFEWRDLVINLDALEFVSICLSAHT